MEENWRKVPAPGFENYEISIDTPEGRCRNTNWRGRIRELTNNKNGRYVFWCLNKTTEQAARWIALTYPELIENEYFEGAEIDHKDTDTFNNQPSNLRWVDRKGQFANQLTKKHMSESAKDKIFTEEHRENMSKSRKGKYINHPSFSKPVIQSDLEGNVITEYPSAHEAARVTGICFNSICDCCRKRIYKGKQHLTAGGYRWDYKNKED